MNVVINENRSDIISLRNLFMIFVLAVIYYLSGMFVFLLNLPHFYVGPFWPAAGFSAFFVLRYGLKVLPGVFIGQFILSIDLNNTIQGLQDSRLIFLFAGLALNASFYIFIARYLILRYTHYQGNILEKTNIPLLLLLAGPVSSFIPILISTFLLNVSGIVLTEDLVLSGLMWWAGDSFGMAIFLPVLLVLFDNKDVSLIQKTAIFVSVIVLLTATLTMFKHAERQEYQHLESILDNRERELAQDIKNEIQRYMHSARHLRAYFVADNSISLQEFKLFANNLLDEHKSINHLEWGVFVNNDERNQFEKNLQALYGEEYHIKEMGSSGEVKISPQKSYYYPVKFVYPYTENKSFLGFDPAVGHGVLNNLLIAIENNKDTLSSRINRFQNLSHRDAHIILYTPFYSNQKDDLSIERNFIGYLSQVINLRKFFEGLTNSRLYRNIQLEINDSSESNSVTLYKNEENNIDEGKKITALHKFYLANKVWSIVLLADQNVLSDTRISTAWYILISGLIVTMIMIVVLLLLTQKQKKIQQLLDNKTAIVKESETYQNLLTATFNTHQAILITNPEYNIIRVNSAFCDIMGYTEVEVVGENPRMFASGRQTVEFYKNMWDKLLGTGRYEGEIWNRRKNGEIFPEYQTITEIRNAQGKIIYYISVFSDITKLKQDEEKIRHQAIYDQLTLLPNRMLFLDRLDQEVAYARRFNGIGVLLLIDIDHFKIINDSIGHHFGDDILIELGHRLTSMLRNTDTVAHLGGDDFIVLMPVEKCSEQEAQQHAILIAEKILAEIKKPFLIKNKDYKLTATLGISYIKNNKRSSSDILRQAESALYRAKMAGKNCFRIYQDEN